MRRPAEASVDWRLLRPPAEKQAEGGRWENCNSQQAARGGARGLLGAVVPGGRRPPCGGPVGPAAILLRAPVSPRGLRGSGFAAGSSRVCGHRKRQRNVKSF